MKAVFSFLTLATSLTVFAAEASSENTTFRQSRDDKNRIIIHAAKDPKFVCYTEASGQFYVAKAASLNEAMRAAKTVCGQGEGRRQSGAANSFFCDLDEKDCEPI